MAKDKTNAVKVQLETNALTLSTNNPEIGEANETLPVEYKGEADHRVQLRYLLDVSWPWTASPSRSS